jgi:hypothetical protein
MQLVQYRLDVIAPECARNQARCRILNALQFVQLTLVNAIQQTVTVVKSAADECINECLGRLRIERAANSTNLAQLEEAGATE